MVNENNNVDNKFKGLDAEQLNALSSRLHNNQIDLTYEKEATRRYFIDEVNTRTRFFETFEEKINYFVNEGYIDGDLISKYDISFIKELRKYIGSFKYRFSRYLGAKSFYEKYAMKDFSGNTILERWEDRLLINALFHANGDKEFAKDLAKELITGTYQPATPTFLNAGKKDSGEMVSCFLLDVADEMSSIGKTITNCLNLSKMGGGVGINLSNLRESGAPIKNVEGAASGVVPVMKLLEDSFTYANQLGQRSGAGVAYLNIFHPDLIEFLSTKKENADEKIRLKTLSLGLIVPDKFYELLYKNETMYLFSPYDVKKYYGLDFSEVNITEMYDTFLNDERINKSKLLARDVEIEISKLQQESGYPYIVNIDTANKNNPISFANVKMSNLCTEIFQIQLPSEMNNKQQYTTVGMDISCNLGSTIIPGIMKSDDFGKSVRTMFRALNQVAESTDIEAVPTIQKANKLSRSVGLGAMGLHTYLAQNHIYYGSPESVEFTDVYFMLLNYWTLVESMNIAKERKETFYKFEETDYATGKYFEDRYLDSDYTFKHESVEKLFENIHIPTVEDWKQLMEDVKENGLYNMYRLAVAPNGSIGYVREVSPSIHPIINLIERRVEGKTGEVMYPAPGLMSDNLEYYKDTAFDIDMRKMIDLYAAAQKHVDQGISMTLYIDENPSSELYPWKEESDIKSVSTRDLNIFRNYAWTKGIKSTYYTRIRRTDTNGHSSNIQECESCLV